MSDFKQKENTASLFKNEKKTEEKQPDYKGKANIGGVEYFISGWINETKNGSNYLSLKFGEVEQGLKPENKEEPQQKPVREANDLPF